MRTDAQDFLLLFQGYIYDLMDAIADQELEKLLEESMAAPTPEEALKCFFR